MKILHIPQRRFALRKAISGIKTVLLEEIKWENKIEGIESKILIYDKIEESNILFINKISIKEDILNYKPDFIIFDGFWTIQHYFIAKFLKKNKIKYYIKPHGAFNKIAQRNSRIKFIKKLVARILFFDRYVKNSEGLIFLNETEKQNSIYRSKNEFILPNGIEKKDFNLNFVNETEKIKFIFLGRIDIFHKGIDILLETLLKNKEYLIKNKIVFNFYGKGRKKDMTIFNQYLNKIPQIVKYKGVVYGEEKYKVLQDNDIFILTSRFEGMPMGVLEALDSGLPCFITRETGMGEYVKRYRCGWEVSNIDNLEQEFKNFIAEYTKNKEIYIQNTQKCKEKFLWNKLIKLYLKEYKKMKN